MMVSHRVTLTSSGDLSASYNSSPIRIERVDKICLQAIWTGTPTGTFKIQESNDEGTDQLGTGVTNWTDRSGSSISAAGSADSAMWHFESAARWVRLVYTRTSGTGTLTIQVNAKGGH